LSFRYWIARCEAVLRWLNLVRCAASRDNVRSMRSAPQGPRPAGPAPQERSAVPGRNIAGPRIVDCTGVEAPSRCEDCAAAGATATIDQNTTVLRSACMILSRIIISDPPFSVRY